jgi:hypothetical protein
MDRNTTVAKLVGYELISGMSAGLQFVTYVRTMPFFQTMETQSHPSSLQAVQAA